MYICHAALKLSADGQQGQRHHPMLDVRQGFGRFCQHPLRSDQPAACLPWRLLQSAAGGAVRQMFQVEKDSEKVMCC
jgi:hypothetical protein